MAEIGKDITKAKMLLEAGEVVAIPTETVYGLAGNALDPNAVARIFSAKNRPHFNPLIVHVDSLERARDFVTEIPSRALHLAQLFWPGPLTLLLPRKPVVPDLVTAGLDTVGIRCPNHPLTLELLRSLAFPLAAPSANPFGYVSPTTPAHVNEQLGDQIDYILDGGPCTLGIESTIVGFEGDKTVLFRLGGLGVEQIEAAIGPVVLRTHATSHPSAPGQLESHYSPRTPFLLGDIKLLLKGHPSDQVGVLCFAKGIPGVPSAHQVILSPTGNLEEAAQHLFAALRELDKLEVETILAEEVPNTGIGRAINDRLRRAAARTY